MQERGGSLKGIEKLRYNPLPPPSSKKKKKFFSLADSRKGGIKCWRFFSWAAVENHSFQKTFPKLLCLDIISTWVLLLFPVHPIPLQKVYWSCRNTPFAPPQHLSSSFLTPPRKQQENSVPPPFDKYFFFPIPYPFPVLSKPSHQEAEFGWFTPSEGVINFAGNFIIKGEKK